MVLLNLLAADILTSCFAVSELKFKIDLPIVVIE